MNKVHINGNSPFSVFLLMIIFTFGLIHLNGASANAAQAPDYPTKPVLFLAMSAPGGGFDMTIRAITTTLAKEKLVTVAVPVENTTSATGMPLIVTRYKNDPYMISVQSLNGMMRHATGAGPSHKEYTPLAGLISTMYCIAVRYDSPYKTLGDLIKGLKENPEKIPISGGGTDDRLFLGATFIKAGLDISRTNYVVFSGGAEGSMSVLEGSTKAVITTPGELGGLVQGKKMRILALSSDKRHSSANLKDIPILKESGIDFEWTNSRYAIAGPDMPDYAVRYWRNVFTKMVKTPTWQELLKRYEWDDAFMVDGFNDFLDKRQAVVTDVMTKLGMAKK